MPYATGAGTVAYGIAGLEWIVLLIVLAILFMFGPKKIPELLRGMGRGMGEFQRGRQEIERELKRDLAETATDDERKDFERRVVKAAKDLGVDVEAQSQREIKLEMAKTLDTAPKDKLVAAAKSLGIETEGVEVQRVKERVVQKLAV